MDKNDILKVQGETVLYTTKRICAFLNVTNKTLCEWRKQGMPVYSHGLYDIEAVLRWKGYVGDHGTRPANDDDAISLNQRKLRAEIKLKEIQAENTQLKTDILDGKYLESNHVDGELTRSFSVLRISVMNIPRVVGALLATYIEPIEARRIENKILEIVKDALEQVSKGYTWNKKG